MNGYHQVFWTPKQRKTRVKPIFQFLSLCWTSRSTVLSKLIIKTWRTQPYAFRKKLPSVGDKSGVDKQGDEHETLEMEASKIAEKLLLENLSLEAESKRENYVRAFCHIWASVEISNLKASIGMFIHSHLLQTVNLLYEYQ